MATTVVTLQNLYVEELRDLYYAESQLIKAWPELAKAANSRDLRRAFEEDAEESLLHIQRLRTIFTNLGQNPAGPRSSGMKGLLKEGREVIRARGNKARCDAGLVVTAQKVQRYEIVGYSCARTFAQILNRGDEEQMLSQTLEEEKKADAKFNELATHAVNVAAAV